MDILVGNLERVPGDDDVDCNHNARTAEAVRTYAEEEAEGNMDDDADVEHHVADEGLVHASVAALHACAFPRVRQLASGIPCADASFPLRHRHRLHLSQDSFHCACPLLVRNTLSPLVPAASMPSPQVEPLNHARRAHHSQFASVVERAK